MPEDNSLVVPTPPPFSITAGPITTTVTMELGPPPVTPVAGAEPFDFAHAACPLCGHPGGLMPVEGGETSGYCLACSRRFTLPA